MLGRNDSFVCIEQGTNSELFILLEWPSVYMKTTFCWGSGGGCVLHEVEDNGFHCIECIEQGTAWNHSHSKGLVPWMMKITMLETSVGGNLVSVTFKVDGSKRICTQSAAREQGMAARARQRRLVCGSGAALGTWRLQNEGLLVEIYPEQMK